MYKKIVGLSIFVLLITIDIGVVSETPKVINISTGPPADFSHLLPDPSNESDVIGHEIWGDDTGKISGRIHRVTDTKDPPNKILDVCDNVVIEWTKDPPFEHPWVTYHIEKMGPNVDGWSLYYFHKKSDSKNPPQGLSKIEGDPNHPHEDGHPIYVDGGNTAGPWDGTIEHPYQYTQNGIDASNPGDNIHVFYGIYQENLVIEKNYIAVVPMTFNQPVIDGGNSGSVVTITGDWVILNGFRIQNSGKLEEDAGIDIRSDNTTIFGNYIQGNQNGIYLHQSANNNEIYENNIQLNVWGLFIWDESNDNMIYTNNLINNTGFNAKDKSENKWYSEIYHGNYWDDYSGFDNNGDGIGDIPYLIPDSGNQDLFPLMNPMENIQPGTPDIFGSNSGKPNKNYTFSFISLDPNGHDLLFEIDWGDGFEEISSFYNSSGQLISFNHSWESKGSYTLKVKAIDCYGAESDWATLDVTMSKIRFYGPIIEILLKIFQRFPFFEKILNQ